MILSYGQVLGTSHNAREAYQWDKVFEEQLINANKSTRVKICDTLITRVRDAVKTWKELFQVFAPEKDNQ